MDLCTYVDNSSENLNKIDEKSFQMGGKIGPKSRKSVPGGTPNCRQEAKMIKRGVVSNSLAVFLAILEENGSQDEDQNRTKINNKVVKKLTFFCLSFEGQVGAILVRKWYQNPSKN